MTLSEWLNALWTPKEMVALYLEREDLQAFLDEGLQISVQHHTGSLSEYLAPVFNRKTDALIYLRKLICGKWYVTGWDYLEWQAVECAHAPRVRFSQYLKEMPALTDLLFEE